MAAANRKILWVSASLFGLLLLLLVLLGIAANHQEGQRFIERTVATLTAGQVILTGLSGPIPRHIALDRLELRDDDGAWLTLNKARLDWDWGRLLAGEIKLDRLSAEQIAVNRLPPPSSTAKPQKSPSLPLAVAIDNLTVGRLELAEPVAGSAASLNITGSAALAAIDQVTVSLLLRRLDSHDQYRLDASVTPAEVAILASIKESQHGLLASLAKLPQPYPFNLDARLQGPWSTVDSHVQLKFGPLQAEALGQVDFYGANTQLNITAQSSNLQLLPNLSWQSLALAGQVSGSIRQANANAKLDIQQLSVAETEIGKINLAVNSLAGQIHLSGDVSQLKSAQLPADPLQNHPLKLSADFDSTQPDKSLDFILQHPAFTADGKVSLADQAQANVNLAFANLQPLAILTGLDWQGKAEFKLNSLRQGQTTVIDGGGTLTLTAGDKLLQGLLGKQTGLSVNASINEAGAELASFALKSNNLNLHAQGKAQATSLTFGYDISLQDLAALGAAAGKLALQGQIHGQPDDFAVTADLTGTLGYQANGQRFPAKPVTGKMRLNHLPKAADGQLDGKLWLAGSPLDWVITAKTFNGLQVAIERVNWQSARLQGQLTVPPAADFAVGKLGFTMSRLADLQPLLGLPLSGSIDGTFATRLDQGQPAATLQIQAERLGLEDNLSVKQITLALSVNDLLNLPRLDGKLNLGGINSETIGGDMQLAIAGPLSALKLQWDAALTDPADHPIKLTASALANAAGQRLEIGQFRADWRQQTAVLLEPLRLNFTNGVSLERLRLGLKQATLELAGQISPKLDLTASLERLPADLLALAAPGLEASGSLGGNARLTGTFDKPAGHIEFNANDVKLRSQQFSLPPIQLTVKALLDGAQADLSGHASAGADTNINLNGQIPLVKNAPLELHGAANVNLKFTDPLLTASGRRVRGQAKLTADLTGSLAELRYTGHLQLDKTELRDYTLGLNITNITALAQADNGLIRLDQFQSRAGQGQISAQGSVNLAETAMPVDLTITARNAQLLASDRLSVNLNSDLNLKGQVQGKSSLLGSVLVNRAEIRVPERLPATIAVLKMESDETQAPPPAKSNAKLGLDLVISAPGSIFVRGRGLDAELHGTVRLTGLAGQPHPEGAFKLRRGEFRLAGKTLSFSEGSVSFDGGSLVDPSLNFVASSGSDNITATLTVGGTASKPKISLSSVPALPQDEILARLLFNRSSANLSVTEMVQIGSALASLTGVDSGLGDPLEDVRTGLGLDRLSVGTSLEGGRYLAPGVYLGAKQGFTGNNPQATIQIDLTKQLKLEATVGPGATTGNTPNTNSVGIIYQYDY